jgi:hypothetical protein
MEPPTRRTSCPDFFKGCHQFTTIYYALVQLDLKPAWLLSLAAIALIGTGCSGISTSHSVSPATFLLPGFFGQTSPAPATTPADPAGESIQTLARSN